MANAKKRKSRAARRAAKRTPRSRRIARIPREPMLPRAAWLLNILLERGRDREGIDAEQFESAVEIVDAFKAITREVGYRPLDLERIGVGRRDRDMSPREVRLSVIYFGWGVELIRRLFIRPHVVVEWIEDERQLDVGALPVLSKSLDLWDKIRGDLDGNLAAQRRARRAVETVATGY